jgi:translation elongation factor EF-G
MKEYTTEFLRNIALVSHGGAGKTMLAEAFLHATGATTASGKLKMGRPFLTTMKRKPVATYPSMPASSL